ncbi:BTAD domain-containing putative transcriptional regulator [Streptomyces sp. So13.3]|uniref:ATP-binding protein n=1 Tax=Streptomyces sp. So13.3 TaxID=2136173 RepID=UPI001FD4713E|nr:BTAD domain-containing putative transcriptional regulator [Streptomyces sp. So13.3]
MSSARFGGAAVVIPARPSWRIQLLGSFAVTVEGVAIEAGAWRLRKAKALVAMLALAPGQRCHREHVLDELWPDLEPAAAARNLHQTLYVARRAVAGGGPAEPGRLSIREEQVVLDVAGPVEVDVLRFEVSVQEASAGDDVAMLRAAADLYAGDLLPDLSDADWLTTRREQLRTASREISVRLATVLARTAPEEALLLLTRALDADPVHEGAVRVTMGVLAGLGRRSEALARYERLVDDLLDAFGTDPDAQTVALFRELLTGAPAAERPRAADVSTPSEVVGHLPAPLTSFVGREREIADVERLTRQARLLTLTGAGGSGKTRLAVEAARRVRSRYPDGAWFVDLTAVAEPVMVADAVAKALGLDSDVADRGRALVDQLRSRRLLIVLDNCEHLLAACAGLVGAILAGCSGVDVLATSREPLHAQGEFTLRVPSLTLPSPDWDRAAGLEQLAHLPSVLLFVDRAAQVRPGFALDADNAPGVVELCRRLDGMPLALELAAAKAAALEPAEIVHRLSDVLSLLCGGGVPITRHQTLRGTLEWSHNLLAGPEQVLLRRLSVFAGSFTLEAAEAVCGDPPLGRTGVFEVLVRLVDQSLVVPARTAATTRYRLLETVRQFAHEKLVLAGEAERSAAVHGAYFLAFAMAHNPERAAGVVREEPKLLDGEHDNLRAALGWACKHDAETALRLAANLWRFWFLRGHAVEGARWLERALAMAPEPTRPRAAALIGLTGLDSRQGRSDRHRALGAEAVAIVRRIGEPDEVVMARIAEATLVWSTFDLDEAERMAIEVRAEGIARGRPEHAAAGSWLLGHCALFREDGPLAIRHLDSCLIELAHADTGTRPFLPVITPCLLLVPIAGRLVPYMEETMLLGRRVGVVQATGYAEAALGYAHRLTGNQQAALSLVAEAVDQFADLGDDLARAQALHQIGCLHRDMGAFREAGLALSMARDVRSAIGDRRGELLTDISLGLLQAMAGDISDGLGSVRRSLSGFEAAGDVVGIGATLTALGAIELLSGETRAARELYRRAAERFAPWPRFAGWLRLAMAELSTELDDHRRAARETAAAASVFDPMRCVIAGRHLATLRDGGAGGDARAAAR